ncbi:putative disease resistance protein RGA3 [Elaeis guineensis]|uniref:Disease resistance protein RGA3 n=1 Tax=Elaeis guineensis var. tenera TaxID=51953 RepID=A0A6I9RTD0_ELAGV|nr:putative disease resistance protein RGA3 [Elaeis guineensis]
MDVSSYITIGGWFIQVIFDKYLSSKLQTWATNSGIGDDLDKLRIAMLRIQSVVSNAEGNPAGGMFGWMKEFRDVSYDAEDLLDELEYRRLQQELEAGSSSPVREFLSNLGVVRGITTQASGSLSSRLSNFTGGDDAANQVTDASLSSRMNSPRAPASPEVTWDRATKSRIRNIVERLNQVASCVSEALQLSKLVHGGLNNTQSINKGTTSSLIRTKVFGRGAELEKIRLLLKSEDERVSVLPIVGLGGIGKTTLAQLVYNDPDIVDHFELRMWVHVSDNFDETKLTREMLEYVSGDKREYKGITNFNSLQVTVMEKLMLKRFLLVLDDVWKDERSSRLVEEERWERFLSPLKAGKKGSKILMTTRLATVAEMVGTMDSINLAGLRDHDCWSLIKECTFDGVHPDKHPKLQNIGRKIANKLKGLPVAAKAVAGLLKNKLDADEWIKVLESNDIWNDIMPVLDFSYQHLPAHLQRCFAYCSIFPKYWKFKTDDLVHLWMAQGYIQPQNKKLMEDIGREYLNDLLCRSFFDTHKNGPITYYVMHGLLHDLAETVSLDECLRIEDEPTNAPLSIRHVSVRIEKLANLKGVCQLRNLRTLILFGRNPSVIHPPVLKEVFKDFHCIRTLDLSFCKMEKLPEAVGHLIHLRYLNLSSTSIRVLPESLCRLYNLQVLNLQGCRLQVLPSGMNKLINLRHLTAAHQIVTTIAGIGRLTCLQQLQVFRVRREVGYEIGQLKDLNELRGLLQIRNLENVETENEASEAMLDVKEHLSMLQLVWDSSQRNGGAEMEVQVIESLRPHPNLKRLEIRGCRVAKSPSWLETELLNNLEFIYLSGCRFWECLPPFGKMPSLKVLWLQGMHAVKRVGFELEGNGDKVFPCLEELVLDDLPELEVLSGDEQLFFSLHSVMVKDCIKLKSLPPFLPNITQLTIANQGFWIPYYNDARMAQISSAVSSLCIYNCPMLTAGFSALLKEEMVPSFSSVRSINMLRSFSSLRSLNISDISLLTVPPVRKSLCSLENLDIQDCHETTFSTEQQEVFQGLTSLQSLCISNCANLQFLPEDLNSLSSLQKLFLWNCPSIQSMPEKGLPISLKVLEIESCHPPLKERCKKEQGIDWQRIAHISHIEIDGEVL